LGLRFLDFNFSAVLDPALGAERGPSQLHLIDWVRRVWLGDREAGFLFLDTMFWILREPRPTVS